MNIPHGTIETICSQIKRMFRYEILMKNFFSFLFFFVYYDTFNIMIIQSDSPIRILIVIRVIINAQSSRAVYSVCFPIFQTLSKSNSCLYAGEERNIFYFLTLLLKIVYGRRISVCSKTRRCSNFFLQNAYKIFISFARQINLHIYV